MEQSTVEFSKTNAVDIGKKVATRVLHVDDDAGFLKTAKPILDMQGAFQVDTAASVEEAWEKMKEEEYDAVVSDYQMPGKDGLQFLKELRQKGDKIPFVVFTGKGREEVAIKALNLGADGYFNKTGQPETVYGELAHGIQQVVAQRKAEQLLLKSEDKYRRLVETLHEGIWAIDKNSYTTFVNSRMAEILGYSIEEMMGKHLFSFMDEHGVEMAKRFLKRREEGIKEQHDFEFIKKDGKRICATLETSSITDDNGNYSGALASVMDTTERKKAEEDLKESEERFRQLIEFAPDAIFTYDLNGNFLGGNRQAEILSGFKKEELVGKNILTSARGRALMNVLQGRRTDPAEYELVNKDGSRFDVEISTFPVNRKGKVEVIAIARDITERKKAEEALRESEKRYHTLFNVVPVTISITTVDGKAISVNNAIKEMSGYTPAEFLALNMNDIYVGLSDRKNMIALLQKEGKVRDFETRFKRKDGTIRFMLLNADTIVLDNQTLLLATVRDVTEIKKAEVEIRSLARFPSENPNPILRIAKDGIILYANAPAKSLPDELKTEIGQPAPDFLHQPITAALNSGLRKEIEFKHSDRTLLFVLTPVTNEGYVNVYGRDITERKKARQELQQQKEKAEKYLNIAGNIIVALDSHGKITLLNRRACEILGYNEGELVGKDWFETCLPEERKDEVRAIFRGIMQGKLELYENEENLVLTKDGEKRIVSWHNSVLKDDDGKIIGTLSSGDDITERRKVEEQTKESEEKYRKLLQDSGEGIGYYDLQGNILMMNEKAQGRLNRPEEEIVGKSAQEVFGKNIGDMIIKRIEEIAKSGKPKSYETFVELPTGKKWFLSTYSGIRDNKGKISGVQVIGFDISEKKKAEEALKKSLEKLRALSEKLTVVGKLTRHDIRNKLSAVVGNTYLAKKALPKDHKALAYLEGIESASGQATKILDFAAAYESLGVEELTSMEVGKAFDGAVMLFSGLQGAKLVNECHGLTVMADSLLRQLFYNLIDDSLKHGKKVSRINIHYEEGKDGLRLFYEDDGVGMPKALRQKIFAEGFTTGKGSGYGLYLIKKMTEVYGWTIEEKGESGKGAKFVITIPKTNLNGKENYQLSRHRQVSGMR